MLPIQHHPGGTPHCLRRHKLCLRPREPHGHGAVGEGLQEEAEEGGTGAAERGGDVHVRRGEGYRAADTSEEPIDEGGEVGWEGRRRGGDHGHGFANEGGGVGHDADDAREGMLFVLGFIEDIVDLGLGDAGADADQEFVGESRDNAGFREDLDDLVRLAGEDDDGGGGDAADILVLENCNWVVGDVFGESFLDFLCGFRAADAGDEAGWSQ